MPRINNNVNQLVDLIQKQISSTRSTEKTSTSSAKSRAGATPKKSSRDLALDIHAKIGELDNVDDFSKRTERILLESVIAFEFGDHILNDSRFSEMITEIHFSLASSKEFSTGIAHWIKSVK